MQKKIYVSNKSNDTNSYSSIQDAIDSIPLHTDDEFLILVSPGVYYEKIELAKANVTIEGTSKDNCIITYDDGAFALAADGSKLGTFRSYTFFIDANDVTLKNLTIKNTAGFGRSVGQAIALYAEGDHILVENCTLFGHQDTLFTGPLPPKAFEQNGFVGPTEFSPRITGHQYYHNCTIEGDIDFIFGSAYAFFESCTIISHMLPADIYPKSTREDAIHGYITAASTKEDEPYGYVFYQCDFVGDAPKHSVYLGRPWRQFASVLFHDCNMGEHIHPAGFHDWNKTDLHDCFRFSEGENHGPGSNISDRAVFVSHKQISANLIDKLRNLALS